MAKTNRLSIDLTTEQVDQCLAFIFERECKRLTAEVAELAAELELGDFVAGLAEYGTPDKHEFERLVQLKLRLKSMAKGGR
jgi:hypothetical protein